MTVALWLASCGGGEASGPGAGLGPSATCDRVDCANRLAPEIAAIEPRECSDVPCPAPLMSEIRVRFSEPIDPLSVDGGRADCSGSVVLRAEEPAAAPGTCVEGVLQVADVTVTLTPAQPLSPATRYHVHIGQQVRDASGAQLLAPFDWQFVTQAAPACGNGELSEDEVCDDGNTLDDDYCSPDCTRMTGECGDGIHQANVEACDDGNPLPLDGCTRRCTLEWVEPKLLAGTGASCGLRRDGSVLCWGSGPLDAAPDGEFEDLAIADDFACALGRAVSGESARNLVCWGGATLSMSVEFTHLWAGGEHVCGVRADGSAQCIAVASGAAPLALPEGTYVEVAVDDGYACGVRTDGTLGCAGDAIGGLSQAVGVRSVALGDGFACTLDGDGSVECVSRTPGEGLASAPAGPFIALDAAGRSLCGLLSSGKLACWRASGGAAITPSVTDFVQFALGPEHGCGMTREDRGVCWAEDSVPAARVPDDY